MLTALIGQAQEKKTQTYQLNGANKITLNFEYPHVIKIRTWDKKEVQVISHVDINDGKDNDNFVLIDKSRGKTLSITSELKGLDRYDNVYMSGRDENDEADEIDEVDENDDNEKVTVTKNGRTITSGKNGWSSHKGVKVLIELEVFVPKSVSLEIDARYGLVEVIDAPDNLEIIAKFGGVDLSIKESDLSFLSATTSWGQVFSNLDKKFSFKGDDMIGKTIVDLDDR